MSATFFPAAPTPTPLFWAADAAEAGALPPFLMTVVAFEVVEASLLLLAILVPPAACVAPTPRLALVAAGFTALAAVFVAFFPAAAFPRVTLGFSDTIFASVEIAAMAADLAGVNCLEGDSCLDDDTGFSGEGGRER